MHNATPQLSVVIPVLDERGNVGPLIGEIRAALADKLRYEMVVADDASTGGTCDEVDDGSSRLAGVRLVRHEQARGPGEKAGRSVIPVPFRFLGMGGSGALFVCAARLGDPVFVLGQSMGAFAYLSNLFFVFREKRVFA